MNHPPDSTVTADNGANFDPRQAAALLGETTRQARRQLEPYPPWMSVIRAVTALAACGAVWLSVRGQHPYEGPPLAVAIPVVAAFVIINFAATVAVAKHANTGVSGKSRLRPPEIAVMTVAWVGVFVVMGALAGAGASRAIVYGLYPTTVPLIVAGLAWAGIIGDPGKLARLRHRARGRRRRRGGRVRRTGRGVGRRRRGPLHRGPRPRRRHRLATAPQRDPAMTTDELDPLIHVPTRLKIVATLAALPDGDGLSFTRLQNMLNLTPGNLIIQLRKLEEAGYLSSEKTGNGSAQKTTVALTSNGRKALATYTQTLRDLLGGL